MAWFALHAHAMNSTMDGMGRAADHVAQAAKLGHPAFALTDHGSMGGIVEMYQACRKHGIEPLPGIEAYAAYGPRTRKTFHMGLVATSETGYCNLVQINNRMMRDAYYKPLLDLTIIDQLPTEDVIVTTGCHFGLAQSAWRADTDAALNVVSVLAAHFDVFVEAQAHGIDGDDGPQDADEQLAALAIADTLGLPLVLGQDSHYVYPWDRRKHDMMKRLGSWSKEPDLATFPGRYGYHIASEDAAREWYLPEVWERGMQGMDEVLSRARVRIPPLEEFTPVLPSYGDDDEVLSGRINAWLDDYEGRYGAAAAKEYRWRLISEFNTIEQFGFAGYLLLVAEVTDYLRKNAITYDIRGSANGSLVCYALGITSIDPLAWGLSFDRFLSRDRAKPPDVDIDIDSLRREEVITHLRHNYVVQRICSYPDLSIAYSSFDGRWRGTAVDKWIGMQHKTGGTKVMTEQVAAELEAVCASSVCTGRGTHAAGLVIAPDEQSMRWLPAAFTGSSKENPDRLVTAFDMDDVEALGYVKLDLLGLKMLTAVDHCARHLGGELDDLPLDDDTVYAMIGAGMTDGVFQLDGWTTGRYAARMRPDTIDQLIDCMALTRPATRDSGASRRYMAKLTKLRNAQKAGGPEPDTVGGLHPDIASELRRTLGELLYQEQLIGVLKALGFDADSLARALKAVKSSNNKTTSAQRSIAELIKQCDELGRARGWSRKDVDWLKGAFSAYAGYGFNLSHATGYGLLAYRTAWLSAHHPGVYFEGLIKAHDGDTDKTDRYMRILMQRGFKEMEVDVNKSSSEVRIEVQDKEIYPPISTVKGVGPVAAAMVARNAPYSSLDDFTEKMLRAGGFSGVKHLAEGGVPSEAPGVVGALARAGAFRSLNRKG